MAVLLTGVGSQAMGARTTQIQGHSGVQAGISRRAVVMHAAAEGGSQKWGLGSILKNAGSKEIQANAGSKQVKLGGSKQVKLGGSKQIKLNQQQAADVLVAGATGRTGARIVRELLKSGLRVRAAARDVEQAQQAVEMAVKYGIISSGDLQRLRIVELDFSQPDSVEAACTGVSKVVSALGASEGEALKFDGPKNVDGVATTALIRAAQAAGCDQFVLVTSLGTGKIGFPASLLNLFWGVLYWKRQAEVALEGSGMAFTILRPGGMERPTDAWKKTYNMVLSPRDTIFGGTVSRLQVAELIGAILKNPELGENKVLEISAETTAPKLSYEELLSGIPSDVPRSAQLAYQDEVESLSDQADQAEERLEQARDAVMAAEDRAQQMSGRLQTVKAQEAEVKARLGPMLQEIKAAEQAAEAAKKATLLESAARAVFEAAKKAIGQGQLLDKKELRAISDQILNPTAPKPQLAFAAPAAAQAPAKAAPAPVTSTPPPKVEAKAPDVEQKPSTPAVASPAGFFGGLFNFGQAVDAQEKMVVATKPPPPSTAQLAPEKAAAPVARAAPAPPAAPSQPAAPVEDGREVERRAMMAIQEERREKANAAAKKRADASAAVYDGLRAASAKAAQQKADLATAQAKPTPAVAPKPAAPAAPKPAAVVTPAAPKPAAVVTPAAPKPAAVVTPAAPKPAAVVTPAAAKPAPPVPEAAKPAPPAPAAAKPAPPAPAAAKPAPPAPAAAKPAPPAPTAAKPAAAPAAATVKAGANNGDSNGTNEAEAAVAKARMEAQAWIKAWKAKQAQQVVVQAGHSVCLSMCPVSGSVLPTHMASPSLRAEDKQRWLTCCGVVLVDHMAREVRVLRGDAGEMLPDCAVAWFCGGMSCMLFETDVKYIIVQHTGKVEILGEILQDGGAGGVDWLSQDWGKGLHKLTQFCRTYMCMTVSVAAHW
eukprot:CAMPEP_0119115850 /NCGR_PEP_ID=MMETSP1180-20130426/51968_1 /TAXON_ID=3052 ORGANISM="Chlamydomonas cf sp, Strain CCMP681" /NCGR_SAMPLE_ID=MMETSP1180 /ASSEMBLY_ACC=CAM_ASM_000741 /LENGTH=937 /DNA_ID=CAMNT_0007104949 /DNA_START=11 /DNA_END=2823 /DNA_ORIENTATION=+